jgi:hypothetical protein
MPAIKAFVTAGAVLCSLVLICPPSYATAVGWTSREGTVRGFADADQAGLNIAGSVESADAGESPARARGTAAAVACRWQVGYAAADELLKLRPESTGLIGIDRVEPDGGRSLLYARVCGDRIVTWRWLRAARVGDVVASVASEVRRRLPTPRGRFSPDLTVGAVARLPLWFAVPGQWSAVSVSAQVPGASVTVTATPTVLRFDAGDGSPPVSCAGPGPVFVPGMPEPSRPPACSYTYRNASTVARDGQAWPATLAVDWTVTWAASNGDHGDLAGLTAKTQVPVVVREIEAVERAGR